MGFKTKEFVRRLLTMTPLYKNEKKRILESFDYKIVESLVRRAIKDVPYYKSYSQYLAGGFDLHKIPILHKQDIMGNERRFVTSKVPICFFSKKETGGSTGQSLELYYSPQTVIKKEAMPQFAFSLVGNNLRIATLRGNRPKGGELFEIVNSKHLILSSYNLSESTIGIYIKLLNEYKIECLHVYPSALTIFIRMAKKLGEPIKLPYLKGIVSSSEIFSKDDKTLVREVLPNVKLVDYYSQNELVCAAISINNQPYTFYSNYGFVEFRETGEYTTSGNKIAEIVATSIMNEDMPFIRYATEDFVELDSTGSVVSIIGRTSDFVVNSNGEVVPCIVCTRTKSMQNVISFQYYQDTIGQVVFKVKVSDAFCQSDKQYLLEDLKSSFNLMECKVEVVDEIEKTKRGKQLRLIQKLDINKLR